MSVLKLIQDLVQAHAQQQGARQISPLRVHANQAGPLQNYNDGISGAQLGVPQGGQLQQGGQYNPGLTPLQGSYPALPSVPGQATPQFQGYQGIQASGHRNPQVRDLGYYWNQ